MESVKLEELETGIQITRGTCSIVVGRVAHGLLRGFEMGSNVKAGVGQGGQVGLETLLVQLL